jgi:hypothetical protein
MALVMASTGCEKGGEKIEKLALMGSNNLSGYSGEFLENPIRLEWSGWEGVNYHVHARFIEGTGFIAGRGGFDSFYSSGQEWEFNCKLGGESVQKIEISLYKGDV